MEVPAPFAGTVKEIKISTGDKVKTGSLIMVFEVEGAAPAAVLPRLQKRKANLSSLKTTRTFTLLR